MATKCKQSIVMRKDTDPPMRAGKMLAQGGHAAVAFLLRRMKKVGKRRYEIELTEAEEEWLATGTAKIGLRCDSEQELLDIYNRAKESGLEVNLITDSGLTEFKEPTKTCLAIGPDRSDKIDKITGDLKLL